MSKRRHRALSAEEKALWEKVKEHTTPLHPTLAVPVPVLGDTPKDPGPPPRLVLEPFRIGEARGQTAMPGALRSGSSAMPGADPVQMDKKVFARLTRGKLSPEARLDLHGQTLSQAHGALTRFVLDAHARRLRLILIITGKGKSRDDIGPIPMRRGVLRHQVPQWLASPGLSYAVLQVSQAHARHGGAGAFYVYLRRQR